MSKKTTKRYFAGDKDNDSVNLDELIGSEQNSRSSAIGSDKVVKTWKPTTKRDLIFKNNDLVSKDKLKKYQRADKLDKFSAVKHKKFRKRLKNEEQKKNKSVGFAARSELLLPETSGFLEVDDNEKTYQITQKEIVESVDITSATKHFDLDLDCGQYSINYYRNGRHLLMGGRRGHVAAIDWATKDLICEFNVQESVHDIHWLHMPTMFAVAQKDWTFIYDSKGTQIHCLKKMYRVYKLEFLPYHFLLVSASDNGFISWLDTTMGQMVTSHRMKVPRLTALKQNPYNALIASAHPNGTVDMWSPNQKEAVVSMLCHPSAVRDIAFDIEGKYMVSAGTDRTLRVWDIRNYKCLQDYRLRSVPNCLDASQRNCVAVGMGNVVEVYNDCFRQAVETPYMRHRLSDNISDLEFCYFEDVLGLGHQKGFTSVIIPGSGEPNFDAFETNPYMTASQRKEMEVKALLEKIPAELISLEPNILGIVDKNQLKKRLEDQKTVNYVKPNDIEFEAKPKKKRTKSAKKLKTKIELKEKNKRSEIQRSVKQKNTKVSETPKNVSKDNINVLERFKPKV